jgi:RNA polymerase sigma-70 factor, ECF subfamily
MSDVDDGGLLERARGGDEVAFSQLFGRYQRAIYRYAVYMGGPDAGDDIVQETFLAVLRQRGRADRPQSTLLAYLIGIARRLVLKRHAARGEAPFSVSLDESFEEHGAMWETETQVEKLKREEVAAAVRAAVQSLPEAYREVVVLCDLEEMDYTAAAALMECPIGTVRSRLHRARSLLTSKLAALQSAGRAMPEK